ncbi:hypothetical protein [Scytonema sp. PCC 10023]|uniref:hypothetical protein n=1 Tax=Scytonema sp. PCC 10023 TaxID=1680591 RepID=UPI0039C665A8
MISPAHISKFNGAKSNGPKSPKGKQITRLNATKHGLRAIHPPTVGDDALIFQRFVQDLIIEFDPQTTTDTMLVEQVAMARLRLYRLWATESALAQSALTPEPPKKPPTLAKYFYYEGDSDENQSSRTIFHPENRVLERNLTLPLLSELESYYEIAKNVKKSYFLTDWHEWLESTEKTVNNFLSNHPYKKISVNPLYYPTVNEYIKASLDFEKREQEKRSFYGEVLYFKGLLLVAKQNCASGQYPKNKNQLHWSALGSGISRMKEMCETRLTELKQIDQEIQQAEGEHAQAIAEYEELIRRSQAIPPQIELLTRYEKHINRTLYNALDRLKVRQQAVSMGSFGQKGE